MATLSLDGLSWRRRRVLVRVERAVDEVLAEHATTYWQRGYLRTVATVDGEPRVVWRIDGEPVLELRFADRGPSTLVVHDFSLYDDVRRALRTRHVTVRFATARDALPD